MSVPFFNGQLACRLPLLLTASGKVQKLVLREQTIKAFGLEEVTKTKTA